MYVEIKYVQLLPISQIAIPECTEVRFVSFLSGGFITAIVVNPLERKLAKRRPKDSCVKNFKLTSMTFFQ